MITPHRSVLIVITDIGQGTIKIRVMEMGHGNEKLVLQSVQYGCHNTKYLLSLGFGQVLTMGQ